MVEQGYLQKSFNSARHSGDLPSGTITFLFTDIEGSTKLWQEYPVQMKVNLARHDAVLRAAIEQHNGYVFKTVGDAFCAAFPTATHGLAAAIDAQKALAQESWGECGIKVRMGLHTGDAEERDSDYFGNTVNRVARLMSAGHGGQTLLSLATQELIRDKLPNGVSLTDLGERRLKDLIRPEHIFQLNVPGLATAFAPLKTLDAYRHNLPAQTTSFIGRENEMAELKQALAGHRLVTLTGLGGTGKTRLSLQIAADLLDQFPNGVWFVELAPITEPDLIPQTILSAADMQPQQGRTTLDSLLDFLREKTSLVVLDNCEHLIEACAKLADKLLPTAPNLKILASSREALGVPGEMAWRVPSLTIPNIKHLPSIDQLSQYEAVRLFIERAKLVQQNFSVTNDNAPAVAQICFHLDGIPLAIELAAARIRMMSAEQISSRLYDRFHLLTGGSRTALPRQQTLRALIDWSYDLLSENERILLRRLSVFVGGCTLEATEKVCSDVEQVGQNSIFSYNVLDWLTHLVDKSLVVAEENGGQARYHLLETVRQYAWEKLQESQEIEIFQERHCDWYYQLAERGHHELQGPNQLDWFSRLESEIDNLRAALGWAFRPGNTALTGIKMVSALAGEFWVYGTYLDDVFFWGEKALNHSQAQAGTALRAKSLYYYGMWMFSFRGKWQEGLAMLEESWRIFQNLGDAYRVDSVYAQVLVGFIMFGSVDQAQGAAHMRAGLQSFRETGDQRGQGWALNFLTEDAITRGDLESASAISTEGASLYRACGDYFGEAVCLQNLEVICARQGRYQEALEYNEAALKTFRSFRSKGFAYQSLMQAGDIYRCLGKYPEAESAYRECLAMLLEISVLSTELATSNLKLGYTVLRQGDVRQSAEFFQKGLALSQEQGFRHGTFLCMAGLAAVAAVRQKAEVAAHLFGAVEVKLQALAADDRGYFILLPPVDQGEIERYRSLCRAQLSEADFNAFIEQGRAMSLEQAVAYALGETP